MFSSSGVESRQVPDRFGNFTVIKHRPEAPEGRLAVGGEAVLLLAKEEIAGFRQPGRPLEYVIKCARGQAGEVLAHNSARLVRQGALQRVLGSEVPGVEKVYQIEPAPAGEADTTPAWYAMTKADADLSFWLEHVVQQEQEMNVRCVQVAQVGLQMARTLAGVKRAAKRFQYDEADVVHRDLKPQNALLRATGDGVPEVSLSDINGVAGREEQLRNSLSTGQGQGNTQVMQTLHYMSPEQYEIVVGKRHADNIDLRADVYSLGLVMLEGVAGLSAMMRKQIPSDVQPGLRHIIQGCLEDVDKRYTPEELEEALRRYCARHADNMISVDEALPEEANAAGMSKEGALLASTLGGMDKGDLLRLAARLGFTALLEIGGAMTPVQLATKLVRWLRGKNPKGWEKHLREVLREEIPGLVEDAVRRALTSIEIQVSVEAEKPLRRPMDALALIAYAMGSGQYPRNKFFLAWKEEKPSRQNVRGLAPVLAKLYGSMDKVRLMCHMTDNDPALIPDKMAYPKDLWEKILNDFIDAGGIERPVLQNWCNNPESNNPSAPRDNALVDALAILYPDYDSVVNLCKRANLSTRGLTTSPRPTTLWHSVYSNWAGGGHLQLDKMVEQALREIEDRFENGFR